MRVAAAARSTGEAPLICLGGHDFVPDVCGALFWPAERMLIAADLHLEKGSSLARRGSLAPPYDTAATLARLNAALMRYAPQTLLLLGDSFHDTGWPERLDAADRDRIMALGRGREVMWITGNHDPALPAELPGRAAHELAIGGITFRHEPALRAEVAEIAGHLHPAVLVPGPRGSVRARCFVSDARRIILPAFGAFTGGLDLRNAAFDGLFDRRAALASALGSRQVFQVAAYSR